MLSRVMKGEKIEIAQLRHGEADLLLKLTSDRDDWCLPVLLKGALRVTGESC